MSQRFVAPADTLARLASQVRSGEPQSALAIDPAPKPARIHSFPSRTWTAFAATLLTAVTLLGWQQVHRQDILSAEMSAEVFDQHLATLSATAIPEVISTDRHTVKPWFQGKLPFSFNLPESLPADTTLRGADLTFLNGQPAALLLLTIHKHEVSVFLMQRKAAAIAVPLSGDHAGFRIRHAATQDLDLVAVSDVAPTDLELLLTALVQAQLRP
jgi:anti-sigma factor RsiW